MRLCLYIISTSLAAQSLSTNPASLQQAFQSNGSPVTATVSITGSGSVQLAPATQSGGNWLAVAPATGSLPLSATVTMDPSGLPDGTYLGAVTIGSSTLSVTILVGNPGPQLPSNGIVNAASYQGGAISPGEIVVLFGTAIGPQIPYGAQIWDGVMTAKVAGARVWFNGTPAPLIYAFPNQLAAVVPFNVAGSASVQVQVENLVARTPPFTVPVQSVTPALFTADGSGKGQLAALNQDASVNSASNPAAKNSIVVLYATGAGVLNPSVSDGTVVSSTPFPVPVSPIQVTIGGQTAAILYAGAAPGLVAGTIQINARIPAGIPTGNAVVILFTGAIGSSGNCTVAVQ
jgi:trimeric autotransporter adhesin